MKKGTRPLTVITGASSGIGAACARYLAEKGHRLHLLSRRRDRLSALCDELNSHGQEVASFSFLDVADLGSIPDCMEDIINRYSTVDNLVLSAGYSIFGKVANTSMGEIEHLTRVNYLGRVAMVKAALPHMVERGGGCICVIASITGQLGFPNYASYGASNFAISGFFKALYHELRPRGVHVGIVYPSGTDTEFFDHPSYATQAPARFYRIQAPKVVAKAVYSSITKRKPELTRPKYMGFAVAVIRRLWPFTRPLVAYLNHGDDDA